ncbi:MAG: HEAT repeat domain-containing protein [Myxococcota bacterium]
MDHHPTADPDEDPLAGRFARYLAANGERLGRRAKAFVLGYGGEAVEPLIALACDGRYDGEDSFGEGWVSIHAVHLLGEIGDLRAAQPLIERLADLDPMDILYSAVVHTLSNLGPDVAEPALHACDVTGGEHLRAALADVLAACGARDERILPILLERLEQEPEHGVGCLGEYGDPAALPAIYEALRAWLADPPDTVLGIGGVHDFLNAIEDLGGTVPEDLASAVDAQEAAQERERERFLRGARR